MKVRNLVKVLEIIKEFCASIAREGCQGCPLYIRGFGCGVNALGGPKYWQIERIKEKWPDYDLKTTSCENLKYSHPSLYNGEYSHPSLYNGECTHDAIPNHRHEDSDLDMIHHPDYYTFRGREAIEAVRIMDGEAESKDGYLMRAIIKLLYRYPRKNGKQDLDLAIECIKMLWEEYTDHPKKREGDMIKHPDHYTFRGVEAIEVVKIMTATATGVEAYLLGCAVKYLYRYPQKNGKQDLDKAIQCIKMLRDHLYGKKD